MTRYVTAPASLLPLLSPLRQFAYSPYTGTDYRRSLRESPTRWEWGFASADRPPPSSCYSANSAPVLTFTIHQYPTAYASPRGSAPPCKTFVFGLRVITP